MKECTTRCSVFPVRHQVNRARLEGAKERVIAGKFGLSQSAVDRHLKNHYGAWLTKSQLAQDIASSSRAMERVVTLEKRTYKLLDDAEDKGDLTNALGAIREARNLIDLLCKVAGHLNTASPNNTTNVQVNVLQDPRVAELMDRLEHGLRLLPPEHAQTVLEVMARPKGELEGAPNDSFD